MTLDELCAYSAQIGLKGVDLLEPEDFETPKKYGLICTMGYVDAGTIPDGLNVIANHDKIEAGITSSTYRWRQRRGFPMSLRFPAIATACPMKKARRT